MLHISVPPVDMWDERSQTFLTFEGQELILEHSLISISKWESKFLKPYLTKDKKTDEELLYYIKCMTINTNVKALTYTCLTRENLIEIKNYIESPMTATTFKEDKNRQHSSEIITSELIYYWMIANQIPIECERWHINRLLTLIKICGVKNQPSKKRSSSDIVRDQASLNAQRKKMMGTKG